MAFTVNPNIFKKLNLKKYYGLFRLRRYPRYRELLKSHPVKFYGIFGYHDLLAESFEEDHKFLELRIDTIIPDIVSKDYLEILRTIKLREKIFVKIEKDGTLTDDNEWCEIDKDKIYKDRDNIRDTLRRKTTWTKIGTERERERILIPVREGLEYSCIAEEEREDKEEFLVLIFIFRELHDDRNIYDIFDKSILSKTILLSEVRTIEQCKAVEVSEDKVSAMDNVRYILHVVGNLKTLRDIVIDKIHIPCETQNIIIGTRVILPVESFSSGEYPSLSEEPILDHDSKANIQEIIKRLIPLKFLGLDPFTVKRLNQAEIKKIIGIYKQSSKWLEKENSRGLFEGDRDKFIGGLCHILDKKEAEISNDDLDLLEHCCDGFYTDLVKKMETALNKIVLKKTGEVGRDNFKQKIDRVGSKPVPLDFEKPALTDLVWAIYCWNEKVCKKDSEKIRINGEPFTEDINSLNKCVPFRNWVAHGKGEKERMTINRQNFLKIIDATSTLIDWLLKLGEARR